RELGTEQYKEYRNMRNGIEGVPSVLRRRYNIDKIPVFGQGPTDLWMTYKIEAVNFRNFYKGLKEKGKRLNAKKTNNKRK
ncbi:MAG: hypothetical protein LBF68_02855, partial [Christensenellaceae bacterium]|nr:hypothetical protein [Christensenellaceae bacterium]